MSLNRSKSSLPAEDPADPTETLLQARSTTARIHISRIPLRVVFLLPGVLRILVNLVMNVLAWPPVAPLFLLPSPSSWVNKPT